MSARLLIHSLLFIKLTLGFGLDFEFGLGLTFGLGLGLLLGLGYAASSSVKMTRPNCN